MIQDIEIWKQIEDFENYEVSTFGNVRNKNTGRILKYAISGGYCLFGLSKNGKISSIPSHRLVAKTFISNPENKPQVNHINKNKQDNNITNLEWCTARENNIHKINEMKENNKIITSNQKMKINKLDDKGNVLNTYDSILNAAESLSIEVNNKVKNIRSGISNVIHGKNKTYCGYIWKLCDFEKYDYEIWKEIIIPNNKNDNNINDSIKTNYYISNLGRFKNSKGIIMENYKPHHSGYIYVRVNYQKYALHRLVASTFLDNPENKDIVNHKDGNKINNKVDNLEFVTIKENCLHKYKTNLVKKYTRKIGQYDLNNNLIKEFESIKAAMDELNIYTIKKVLYGEQKTAGGFIWKYLD